MDLDNFKEEIRNFLMEMKSLLKNFPGLEEIKLEDDLKSNDINNFLVEFNKTLEALINSKISDEQINESEYIKSQLSFLDKILILIKD